MSKDKKNVLYVKRGGNIVVQHIFPNKEELIKYVENTHEEIADAIIDNALYKIKYILERIS